MDIVGAINHNLRQAGVRRYDRECRNENGQLGIEVGFDVETLRGLRNARIRAHVPYDEVMPSGVGYDEVAGKAGRKFKAGIKKAASKVAHAKVVKALVSVAKPLSNLVAPGAAAALTSSAKLIKKSAQLVKHAKAGHPVARKLLTAPLVIRPSAKPAAAPARAPAPSAAVVSQWNADSAVQEAGPAWSPSEPSEPSASEDGSDADSASEDGESQDEGAIDAEWENAE